jgi:hypothetical protein
MGLARRHIQEAQDFSRDVGGLDAEVKAYFFSLDREQLDELLSEYSRRYSPQAASYARQTIPKWRQGKARMSGTVAQRLFDLLPPLMPLHMKFDLAERVWLHFGPSSRHEYSIGPNADVAELVTLVCAKLDEVVVPYELEEMVPHRFHWLSAGDVKVKEKLLNHSRQVLKALATEKLTLEVPVLQRQVREHGDITQLARIELKIHKHIVVITVESPMNRRVMEMTSPEAIISRDSQRDWLRILIGTVLISFILSRQAVWGTVFEVFARLKVLLPF